MKNNSSYITRATSLLTITVGCLVLIGWFLNIPGLKSLLPGIAPIKFNTGVCFVLSGIALYLLDVPAGSRYRKTVVIVSSLMVLLTGLLSFSQYAFGWNLGIDELLWKDGPLTAATQSPGRMSLLTSINFTLLGFIFLMLEGKKYPWLIQALLIAILPGSLGVIFNNLYTISFLNLVPWIAHTDLPTAILFIVLCIGAFFSPAPGYESFSLLKKVCVFFVFIFLLRSLIFFAINKSNEHTADMYKWVDHTHNEVLLKAEQLSTQFNDIESRTNSYIITGDEQKLPALNYMADTINNNIRHLRELTKDNELQRPLMDTLEKHLDIDIRFLRELVNTRRKAGFKAAQEIVLEGQGKLLFNRERLIIIDIERAENQQLAKRKAENAESVQNSSKLFILFQVVTVFLMLITLIMIRNNTLLRNKTEETLQKSLKETSDYKYALDESSIVAITDTKGTIQYVNDNFCKISKYKRKELIGQDHRVINSGFHSKEFIRDLWVTIANGKIWRNDLKNKAKDGTHYWVDTTIVPFLDKLGKPYQYVAVLSDITQRNTLEDELKQFNQSLQKAVEEKTREVIEKEQQYRFLLQNMREGIQVIGYDWKYLFVNNTALQGSKYTPEELPGYAMTDQYPPAENIELFKVLQRCMTERCQEIIENEFTFHDNTKRWFELSIQPVPEGLFILSTDITERKKAEQKLQESERFLNESQEVSKIGSYVLDFNTGMWQGSHELANIFGLTEKDEHTVNGWLSIVHPDHQKMMQKYFIQEVISKKLRFDKEYRIINKKTKKESWVHGIGDLEFDRNGGLVKMLGTIQDITERKKIREILRSGNERFKMVNKATFDTFWDWNYLTNTGQWGEGIIKTFGYTKEKLKYDETWVNEFVHPEDQERIFSKIQDAVMTGLENWQEEYRFRCADSSFKEVFARGTILFDENKKPYRMIGAMTDVTERKRLEKELVLQQMRQQQLITENTIEAQEKERTELGRELHDNINQILATVKMYLEIVREGGHMHDEDLVSKCHEYVDQAMKEIRKLSHSLVPPSLGDIDLEEALHELASTTNLLKGTKIQLVFDEKYKEKSMNRNKELMLFRIVQEQLSNITKYAKAKNAAITLKAEDGRIFLSVADNGDGFDTAKKANGIGLKNISSRVAFYSGNMNIVSSPGKGCILEVYIPLNNKS
jgi:two-component system, NarL family, sensor histidine kinase UhpB